MSTREQSLPTFLKASWGVGALGSTAMSYLINMFVLFFLVRHAGVPAAVAGTMLAATRFYDAVIDPLIGTLSDRTQGPWGRRRPWMLAGALLCPIACIVVFNPPEAFTGVALYGYAMFALLLWCTAYSLFSIPYLALGAEMSESYAERAAIMAYRTFFVYGAGIVIVSGAAGLIEYLGRDRAAYSKMSLLAGAIVGCAMLWAVVFTSRARVAENSERKLASGDWWRTALSNTPYLMILITKMTLQLGTAFSGAAMLFFMTYVLERGEGALRDYSFVSSLVAVAMVPVWNLVLKRVERRPLFIALLVANVAGHLWWLLATPDEPQLLFMARAVFSGAIGAGSVLVSLAMITDTIELDRLRHGARRAGLFMGGFEFMQTTSFIVGPLVVGFAFSAAGLQAGAAEQPESALWMMRAAVAVIPAICCVIGILLLLVYRLDAAQLAALRREA